MVPWKLLLGLIEEVASNLHAAKKSVFFSGLIFGGGNIIIWLVFYITMRKKKNICFYVGSCG